MLISRNVVLLLPFLGHLTKALRINFINEIKSSTRHSYVTYCRSINSHGVRISHRKLRSKFLVSNNEGDYITSDINNSYQLNISYVIAFVLLPTIGYYLFPSLLAGILNFTVDPLQRQTIILELLLSKRLYLYFTAFVTLFIATQRAATDNPLNFGQRLQVVTAELLQGLPFSPENLLNPPLKKDNESMSDETDSDVDLFFSSLDRFSGLSLAIALPLALTVFLLLSFSTLQSPSSFILSNTNYPLIALIDTVKNVIIPKISLFWTGLVCILFTKAEMNSFFSSELKSKQNQDGNDCGELSNQLLLALTVSISLVVVSNIGSFGPAPNLVWLVQNIVNSCIAVTTARVLQLPRLPYILVALLGLTMYDLIAVSGTQQFTDGGESIMEAVATAKLSASSIAPSNIDNNIFSSFGRWLPGLFVVSVGGKVSDALGLADVVFPAMLASWALRFDRSQSEESNQSANRTSVYAATLIGYLLGCVGCELLQTGPGGQPALLYLVPAMSLAAAVSIGTNKEILKAWEFEVTRRDTEGH